MQLPAAVAAAPLLALRLQLPLRPPVKLFSRLLPCALAWPSPPHAMHAVHAVQSPPDWSEILTYFRGSELQNYFQRVSGRYHDGTANTMLLQICAVSCVESIVVLLQCPLERDEQARPSMGHTPHTTQAHTHSPSLPAPAPAGAGGQREGDHQAAVRGSHSQGTAVYCCMALLLPPPADPRRPCPTFKPSWFAAAFCTHTHTRTAHHTPSPLLQAVRGNVGEVLQEKDQRGQREQLQRDLDLEQVCSGTSVQGGEEGAVDGRGEEGVGSRPVVLPGRQRSLCSATGVAPGSIPAARLTAPPLQHASPHASLSASGA